MTSIASIGERLNRQRNPVHPLDELEPRQIAAELRTGLPVPPRWGWGDGQ